MATIPISFAGGGGSGSDDVTATKNQVLKGYTAITSDSDDEPIEGTSPSKAAATYYASTSDQTIVANQYLAGAQTIKAVSQSNLAAGNIKKDVTILVSNGNGNLWSQTGTYSTPSSGQSPIVAGAVRTGYSGFVNGGGEVKGSIPNQSAKTVYATTSAQTAVSAGYYTTGAVNVAALSQSGLSSGNIVKGNTITINNGQSNVWSVSGSNDVYKSVSGQFTLNDSNRDGTEYVLSTTFNYKDISVSLTPVYLISTSYSERYGGEEVGTIRSTVAQTPFGLFYLNTSSDTSRFFPSANKVRIYGLPGIDNTVNYLVVGT